MRGLIGVIHGLQDHLRALDTLAIWGKAVLYHLDHAVVMLALALRRPVARGPMWMFLSGVVVFSGTLCTLALPGAKWLGAITPLCGLSLLVTWLWLASARRARIPDRGKCPRSF